MRMIRSRPSSVSSPGLAYWPLLLSLITVFSIFWPLAHATCYLPNGSDMNTGSYQGVFQPCDPGDEHSTCCGLNQTSPSKCRSDGLCSSTWTSNIWRSGCTDSTWESPSCIKLCVSGTGQNFQGQDFDLSAGVTTITPCGDGSYCCGNGTLADACCSENRGLFVVNGEAVSETASSFSTKADLSTSSPSTKTILSPPLSSTEINLSLSARNNVSQTLDTFARTTVSQASSTFTSSASSSSSSSSSAANSSGNVGIIVGGVIGGVAVLALISGIIAWTWTHHKNRNPKNNKVYQESLTGQTNPWEYAAPENNGLYEVDALRPIPELELRPIVELELRPIMELEDSKIPHKR